MAHQVRRLKEEILWPGSHADTAVASSFKDRTVHLVGASAGGQDDRAGAVHLRRRAVRFRAKLLDGIESGRTQGNRLPLAVHKNSRVLGEPDGETKTDPARERSSRGG